MITRIVVPIDVNISPGTRLALQAAGELVALSPPDVRLFLFHVIPVPYVSSPRWGVYRLQPTSGQRTQAEKCLSQARSIMRKQGVHPEQIKIVLRHGIPAEEIVGAARELDADCIVIGSQGRSYKQQLRRLASGKHFTPGLTTRSLSYPGGFPFSDSCAMQSCCMVQRGDYALLAANPSVLRVFTSDEVAHRFVPSDRAVGRKELEAASRALEQLSQDGMLVCHSVQGQLCYLND